MRAVSSSMPVFAPMKVAKKLPYAPKPVAEPTQPLQAEAAKTSGIWEHKSFSFWDILDAINPLQHIPVISTIYRKITGDDMGYAARIAGDTLYGGLFGSLISSLVSAVANVFVDSTTGKDIGEHMIASITPSHTASANAPHTLEQPIQPIEQSVTPSPELQYTPQVIPLSASPIATTEQSTLPPINPSRVQVGIDQYKWQIMADEIKNSSHHWA